MKSFDLKEYYTAINQLKLPLTILVVVLHAAKYVPQPATDNHLFPYNYFFSMMLGEVGVPTFFFISGFLFFRGMETFTVEDYFSKLRNRVRSLLVPYLLWNLLLIVFYAIVQAIPAFSSYFTGANKRIADYVFEDYILAFWDKGEGILNNATPVLQPFWYIRNLILLSILSPIIYLVAKNLTRFIVIPLLAGWWCLTPYLAFCEISVLFFLLGATSALRQWDFLHSEVRMQFCVCATLCLMDYLAHVVVPIGGWLLMIHRAFLLSAVFFSFIFVTRVSAFLRRPMTWGLQYSFFIYACHYPIVIILCKSAMNFIHTDSLGWQLTIYVSIIVISVAMCIGIYHLLQKKCPKVLNILTGSR